MADTKKTNSPDQDDHQSKPTMKGGTFHGIGTFSNDLAKEATSVNQKTGHHGGGAGEP